MKNLTRRSLLSNSALGAAGLVLGAGLTSNAASAVEHSLSANHLNGSHANCAHNHQTLGHKLSNLIADPSVDDSVKNHAIKTSSCPTCGTGIAPTGLGVAVWSLT